MESNLLNPVGARNPAQVIGEGVREDDVEMEKREYIEGSESIYLPSKGVFYSHLRPEYKDLEKLRIRQLNYTDEDILTTKSYLEDGSVFFELLKNVIVDDNMFPSSGLVPVDRDTILLWLRSTSFGNSFEITMPCPSCTAVNTMTWDLSKLVIPEYEPDIYKELQVSGELTIITPLSDIKVKIAVPSIGKTREFEKSLLAKKKNQHIKSDLFGTGSLMIIVTGVEVDGKIIRRSSEIDSYFKKISLPLSDARYIRKQFEKINLHYETKQTLECKNCDYVQEGIEMPIMHQNFLWLQPSE